MYVIIHSRIYLEKDLLNNVCNHELFKNENIFFSLDNIFGMYEWRNICMFQFLPAHWLSG